MIVRLALPVPLNKLFDYALAAESDKPVVGSRVLVNFGGRSMIGLVIELSDSSHVADNKLKPYKALLETEPLVDAEQLSLGLWAAKYYKYPQGDALMHLLPTLARKESDPYPKQPAYWVLNDQADIEKISKRAVRQRALFTWMLKQSVAVSSAHIKSAGFDTKLLQTLASLEVVSHTDQPIEASKSVASPTLAHDSLTLNTEQSIIVERIQRASEFTAFLIEGVTGSGKTEVYLQAIESVLARGDQVLIMVPEIGLTPQLVDRFNHRFNSTIVALHSGLSDRVRFDAWQSVKRGDTQIVIGTRSSVFVPFKSLGIIIIDEEHDPSFKQQEGFRYHARDVALVRAKRLNIPVVMGSATPALESILNAKEQRYLPLYLTQRAGDASPPSFELHDIKGVELDTGLAPEVISRIHDHLTLGNQVLVFINRRGFAPTLSCQECGSPVDCTRCDAHMTLHRSPPKLHCHHCDRQTPIPRYCSSCNSHHLRPTGSGTERLEDRLSELFETTRIHRVDRDSTQSRRAFETLMNQVNTGDPCILVGTQMLAKGHHFPNVTLVVIVNADAGLFSADLRGMERTAQLIMQVAGRAGRAERHGEVILQTMHAEHPLLNTLVHSGYHTFAEQELETRKQAQLPPFSYQAVIRAEARRQGWAETNLRRLRDFIEQRFSYEQQPFIAGPFPSFMEKRAGMYRAQLLFTDPSRAAIQAVLHEAQQWLESDKESSRVRWNIDIDPTDSL